MIRLVSLKNYAQPEVKATSIGNKPWVTFGKNNSFFQDLIDRSRGSVTNGAAIKSITTLVYGKGLSAHNRQLKIEEWAAFKSILSNETIKRLDYDLYAMGNACIDVVYSKDRKTIATATHIPVQMIAPEKVADSGEIENYYFAQDWSKVRTEDDAEKIPAFGTSRESREILYIKSYDASLFYFSLPMWFSAYQWAELEEEIANYHLNNIQNGLAPSMFISLNGGKPSSDDEADQIANQIKKQYQGSSNAGKMIIQFADGAENASTITPVPLSDASEQYQFLSEESSFKIVSGHRIPSPLILGIPTKSGFSSNADEIKTASILTESYVINPQRGLLTDAFDKLQSYNGFSLRLYFESLNPFAEEEKADIEASLSKVEPETFEDLGEYINDDEWVLIDEQEVDYDHDDDFDEQLKEWNNEIVNLASTGVARPLAKSEQDEKIDENYFITRYKYSGNLTGEREFCNKMLSAGKVYRKEDIEQMGNRAVNPGFGEHGANTYSIWLYKGGPRCHHKWLRQTYMSTMSGIDPRSPRAERISTNKAENKYNYRIRNEKEVSMKPNDMDRKGFSPNNTNLPKDA